MADAGKIIILGIGNLLKGDDGAGVRVIEALERRGDLPPEVELIDGGTGGPTLAVYFEACRALVVVDAVNLDAPPGTVRVFDLAEIESDRSPAPFSLHDVNILPMLELSRRLGQLPPVVRIVGIQPERFDLGDRLSDPVAAAVSRAVEAVMAELARIIP